MSWEGTLFNSERHVAREHICSQTKAVLCACVFWYVCFFGACTCMCVCAHVSLCMCLGVACVF